MHNFFAAIRGIIAALSVSVLLTSCYSSQQLVQPSLSEKISKDPTFLDGIALGGTPKNFSLTTHDVCIEDLQPKSFRGNTLLSRYASILNVVPTAITNVSLYSFIDEWYGTRYRLGGTDKHGIDCSALMQKIYERVFCINLFRTAVEQFQNAKSVSDPSLLKEGDLVFFHIRSSRISHVGMYLMNHFFVHASSSHGVMISSLDDKYWQRYYAGAGRLL